MKDTRLSLSRSSSADFSFGEDSRTFDQSTSGYDKSSTSDRSDKAENQYFGHRENRRVRNLKSLVFLVLFLVTLAVCLVIYFLTRKGEHAEFKAS